MIPFPRSNNCHCKLCYGKFSVNMLLCVDDCIMEYMFISIICCLCLMLKYYVKKRQSMFMILVLPTKCLKASYTFYTFCL